MTSYSQMSLSLDNAQSIDHSSCMIPSSYEENQLPNSSSQQHYSRRFRSSSPSNQAFALDGSSAGVRYANMSNDRGENRPTPNNPHAYNTTNHIVNPMEKGKQHSHRSDIAHSSSNNAIICHGPRNLNQRTACQQSSDSTRCTKQNLPLNELYTFDPTHPGMVETRF